MMKLFIDGKIADTLQDQKVEVTIDAQALTIVQMKDVAQTNEIGLPMTPRNRAILGFLEQINDTQQFNKLPHTARIEVDGAEIIAGELMFLRCESVLGNREIYVVKIVGNRNTWVQKSDNTALRETPIEYEKTISPTTISQSWQQNEIVTFVPVQRDKQMVENAAQNLVLPTKILSTEDYHPFINLKAVVERIFDGAEYKIISQFLESELFKSLYISGVYSEKNVDNLRENMDFLAGKFNDSTAIANYAGRVYADNNTASTSSTSFIVDSANPKEVVNGATMDDVFNTNNCFRKTTTNVQFVPTQEVTVAFEYDLQYTTDYAILSRNELKGFNAIQLHDSELRKFQIVNRFEDKQKNLIKGYQYMAIVFDYVAGSSYQVRCDVLTNPNADLQNIVRADYAVLGIVTFTTRTALFSLTTSYPVLNTVIFHKPAGATAYTAYTGDWAVYDASVKEKGTVNIEARFRSNPQKVTPGTPVSFINVCFSGADPSMKIVLSQNVRIRPIFMAFPGLGSKIKFEDIAAYGVSQLELIKAVAQMFNLSFYTDNKNKEVYIEPRNSLLGQSEIVDWTGKIDTQKPITVSQTAEEQPHKIVLEYSSGDGAVMRWNQENGQKMGTHTYKIESNFAKQTQKTIKNPLFMASINCDRVMPDAPDAQIVQVGDRIKNQTNDPQAVNFPLKIVRYLGLTTLPNSQLWSWPSYTNQYPMAVFHTKDTSLCFEDRDGQKGLHQFYDPQVDAINQGRKVSVFLRLEPQQIEAILNPNRLKQDFRARFKLKINGESALFSLDKICGYDPQKESTKCEFTKII